MGPDIGNDRFIGLWEIVHAKARADHFITESQKSWDYIMTHCPPGRTDKLLHADMFVKRYLRGCLPTSSFLRGTIVLYVLGCICQWPANFDLMLPSGSVGSCANISLTIWRAW